MYRTPIALIALVSACAGKEGAPAPQDSDIIGEDSVLDGVTDSGVDSDSANGDAHDSDSGSPGSDDSGDDSGGEVIGDDSGDTGGEGGTSRCDEAGSGSAVCCWTLRTDNRDNSTDLVVLDPELGGSGVELGSFPRWPATHMASLGADGSTWYTCTNSGASVTCATTSPQASASAANELRVVVAQ